jgi:hypothetical protein
MKNNKNIIWFLSIVLFSVWGAIGYQIVAGIFQSNDVATLINNEPGKKIKSTKYQYSAEVRDPFRFFIPSKRDPIKHIITKPVLPVWVPPLFRLTGILVNKNKRTALVEGSDGSVLFLQPGDTISGVQIMKISEKVVIYTYQKKIGDWRIQ